MKNNSNSIVNKQKVIIAAPFLSISGYGNYSRTVIKLMADTGLYDIFLILKEWGGTSAILDEKENQLFHSLMPKKLNTEDIKDTIYFHIGLPDSFPINSPEWELFKKRINLTMFETDNVLDKWAEALNEHIDLLIVPTEFNKETFKKKVNIPIEVITFTKYSFAVNNSIGNILNPNEIKYFHNCNFGARKGVREIVECFLKTFQNKEFKGKIPALYLKWYIATDFTLQEKSYLMNFIRNIRKEISDSYDSSNLLFENNNNKLIPIYLIHENLTEEQMEAMYNSINYYILPSYGEGLNLPAVEAILHNKPVILSKCSAHLSLLDPNYEGNLWIEGEYKTIEDTPDPFYAHQAHKEGHNYYYINKESLCSVLQKSYDIYGTEEYNKLISTTREYLNNYDVEIIKSKIKELIK